MMISISMLLRGSFDVRSALSENAKVNHRINVAMRIISDDLQHTFYVSPQDIERSTVERTQGTYFEIKKGFRGESLRFTTMNHKPTRYNAKESDIAFVVYEVRESKDIPGRNHLYRGEQTNISSDFKDDPKMNTLAKHIKNLKVEFWTGDSWRQDKWDTTSSDTRGKIPHMVRITIEAWADEPLPEEAGTDEDGTVVYSTVVYLQNAYKFEELKSQMSSMKL